ncbi:MAG: carbon-nitrogen hydrolase family protein [bacterium]|nr:carbon-nitrogen hydrolase family protein [bacterium]
MPKVAIVQHPPILLDREQTLARSVSLTNEAAQAGAQLIIFPEAFIPGYPTWIWRLRPGGDMKLGERIYERLMANAVDMSADHLKPLQSAAKKNKVTILCGLDERDGEFSRSTLFNTYVTIGSDGTIQNRHRKLMPTNPERMVWGFGDASGLRVTETPCGRVGSLLCWENYMPLARYALYSQGVEIYVAPTWDNGDGWIGTLQHIAREGRCWVIGSGTAMQASDIPGDFPDRAELYPDEDEWINQGDSVVIEPGGKIVAGPLRKNRSILFADIDPHRVSAARRSFDVAGHYSRPDIFQVTIQTDQQFPATFIPK